MKTIEQQLSQYAAYHRDSRNIATHVVGIPLIVWAVTVLLSRPSLPGADGWLSPALPAALAAAVYYLRLDGRLGALMCVLLGLAVWSGTWAAAQSTMVWLTLGVGGFIVGWIIQFIGHAWEGRKPAFVDDLMGLIVGPMFVVAEIVFLMGLRTQLRQAVEARAGVMRHPTVMRERAATRRD